MQILIDSREPARIPNRISEIFPNETIGIKTLDCGDIQIDDIIIERKTVSDLLDSIKDGRLLNQAAAMRSQTEFCYLLIEGQITWGYDSKIVGTGWHFRSVMGALLSVQEYGVCIVHSANEQDFKNAIAWLVSRDRSKIKILDPRTYGVPATEDYNIISSLPGIGPDKAERILSVTGSAAEALSILTDDSQDLPAGLGPKTRQNIKKALGLNPEQSLIIGENKNE